MTQRTEEKELYLAALRGDAVAQRKCTEKGKQCGGRCIPKSWNCRIKGEGETPPTRGNAVQLSAEQKARVLKARNSRRRRRALTALAGATAVGAAVAGAAAYGAKNPAKARRLANKLGGGGASEALGVASALGGPAAAGVAGVANLGVAGFQIGARMGAGVAQRTRAIRTYRSLLRKKVVLSRQVKRLEGRTGYFEGFVRRAEANVSAKQTIREATTQGVKRVGQIQRGYNATNAPRSIGQTDKTRKQNAVRAGKELRSANQRLNDHTKKLNSHLAEVAKAKKSLNAANWKLGKIKTGLESASNPIRNVFSSSLSSSRSSFRAGRRQVSGFIRYKGRRGPKADPRSWQERLGLDEAEREERADVVFTNKELHARVKAEAKRKFKVYPSAYANAWMVKEYKKRGGGFRNDDLKKWFNEKWVRMSAKGEILGECGDRSKGEGKPRCLPEAKARALSKKERASTVRAKRKSDPKKNRSGKAKMVPNTFDEEGKKFSKTVTNPETGRKKTVKYGAKGYSIAPGTKKGDRYCARSFGDMKSHNKNCAGKDRNTPLCLSRAKWKCSGKSSRRS